MAGSLPAPLLQVALKPPALAGQVARAAEDAASAASLLCRGLPGRLRRMLETMGRLEVGQRVCFERESLSARQRGPKQNLSLPFHRPTAQAFGIGSLT